MSVTTATAATHVPPIPEDIDSPTAKLIYLYVALRGSATADDIACDLDIRKGSTLTLTGTLCNRDHLRCRDGRFVPIT